jgi:hypothetical protein
MIHQFINSPCFIFPVVVILFAATVWLITTIEKRRDE